MIPVSGEEWLTATRALQEQLDRHGVGPEAFRLAQVAAIFDAHFKEPYTVEHIWIDNMRITDGRPIWRSNLSYDWQRFFGWEGP